MEMEHSWQKNETLPGKQLEISLKSEKDFSNLENWLQPLIGAEEAAQCVFALRSMAGEDFANRCKDATKEFGRRLAEHFGGEESFFDIAPSANFYETRSNSPLAKVGYHRGDYHSVGLLEFKPSKGQTFALTFDLTYDDVSSKSKRGAILILYSQGTREQAMNMLKDHYGGLWKIEFAFDKKTDNFVFCE
jgi:hypothetical protein